MRPWRPPITGYLLDSQQNVRELYRVGLESVRFLLAVGDLLIGWLLLDHAEIALDELDRDPSDRDRAFYSGKVATATFFAKSVLPRLSTDRQDHRGCRPDDHGPGRGRVLTKLITSIDDAVATVGEELGVSD